MDGKSYFFGDPSLPRSTVLTGCRLLGAVFQDGNISHLFLEVQKYVPAPQCRTAGELGQQRVETHHTIFLLLKPGNEIEDKSVRPVRKALGERLVQYNIFDVLT